MILFLDILFIVGSALVTLAVSLGQETTPIGRILRFKWKRAILVGPPLLVLSIFVISSVGQVEAGFRGVVLRFGAPSEQVKAEGIYFVNPLLGESVTMMDVQVHAYEAEASAASRDLQDVKTHVTLNYNLDPGQVSKVYQTLRRDYEPRIIRPAIQEVVKAVTALYDAEKLIAERPKVKSDIELALRDRLLAHGMLMDTISITDFQFSTSFSQAIEAKVVAVQRALEAENKLRQIEVEARQAKASAEGRANAAIAEAEGQKRSAILKAEGEAEALLKVATAQTDANKLLNLSLTDEIIQYSLVQKLGPDIRVIVLPTGQQFILGPEVLK